MQRIIALAVLAAFAGCSSYSEISKWRSDVTVNDGERPVAMFFTQNYSYSLFGCIPLGSGVPWLEGEGEDGIMDEYDVAFFRDENSVDNNMRSLRHALELVGSHRIADLATAENNDSDWSLGLINRRELRTQCMILPDK